MALRLPIGRSATTIAAMAGLALFAPAAAYADEQQSTGQTAWSRGPDGSLYPTSGWKSCAEAQAHGAVPLFRADPGYNPALDPSGTGIECN